MSIYTVGPAAANEAVQSTPDPARLRELGQSGLPTVDEIFSSSKGPGYVEILQRPQVAGDPVPAGDIVALGATVGFVVDQGNETIVTLVSSGVRIQLVTNLGRSEAIRIAESLR